MTDVECPYCGLEQEINHDDGYGYDESLIFEQECFHCQMTFAFTTSISFNYSASKAPCMNGGNHNFKPTMTAPKWWTKMRCEFCYEMRELSEGERIEHNVPPIPEEYKSN